MKNIKKSVIAVIFIMSMLLSLTACSSTPAPSAALPPPPEASEAAPEESASEPTSESPTTTNDLPEYALQTYTASFTDLTGYEVEQIVTIGDWIKSSDTDTLAAAWAAVGGSGAPPEAEDFNGNDFQE